MSVTLRRRKMPSGKIRIYLALYLGGHRTYEALHFYLTQDKVRNKEILRLAEAIRAKRELEVHAHAEGLPDSARKKQSFYAFAEGVYSAKRPLTKRTYENTVDHLKSFAGKDLPISRVTPGFCEQFLAYLSSELHANSAAAYFARFKTILKALVKEGILMSDPTIGIHVRRISSLPKFLSGEELKKLASTACGNVQVREAFLFSCSTGLRFQDIVSLKWNQVRGNQLEFIQSKTGGGEKMPMSESALRILERQKAKRGQHSTNTATDRESVFNLPRRSTVDKVLKTWGSRAGIEMPLSFHKARHTFATLALESGVDIYTTSKLLGHKNLATTQVYGKVTDKRKSEAVTKLPTIG